MAELKGHAAEVLCAVSPELRREFFGSDKAVAAIGAVRLLDRPELLRPADLAGIEVLVTSWSCPPVTAELLAGADRLALIAHTGASVKPWAPAEVFERGIAVTQAGAAMARSVAEVALGFALALLHQLPRFDHALHRGVEWSAAESAPARHEILGCTVGVVGASRTGRAAIELLRAVGAEVIVVDPFLTAADAAALKVELVDLSTLLRRSRIVSLHAPVLPETTGMIGGAELALMPDGAGLVNTARSPLVDTASLLTELATGRISAALDVFDDEPLPTDHPLRTLPNLLLTPHKAAGTVEGRARQGTIVLDEIGRFRRGEPLRHAVSPAELSWMG